MLEFALGIVVSDEEYEMLAQPIQHVERCMLLTNDYWSWPREREQAKDQEAGKVFNTICKSSMFCAVITLNTSPSQSSVVQSRRTSYTIVRNDKTNIRTTLGFLMKQKACPEAAAKESVREMVHEEERKWVEAKDAIYRKYPDLRPDLVKFLENLHTALAGNDYWSSQCYRHNDWFHVPVHPGPEWPKAHELAAAGRARMKDEAPAPIQPSAKTSNFTISAQSNDYRSGALQTLNQLSIRCDSSSSSSPSPALSELGPTSSEATSECSHDTLDDSVLTKPVEYINSMPSKGFRTSLIECLNLWMDVPGREVAVIKNVVDSLHDSSLILDDIEDGSALRRGLPATHMVYGAGQAINSATYLYVQAVETVHEVTKSPQMMSLLLRHLKELFCGQSWDLYWTFHRICPSEAQYFNMIDQKTGAMLRMVVDLMLAAKTTTEVSPEVASDAFAKFTTLLGRFYQVRDDYLNLTSEDYTSKKGWCEDLDEQKFSYILARVYRSSPGTRDNIEGLFNAMKQLKSTPHALHETKRYILSLIESTGALEATRRLLLQWQEELSGEITGLESLFGSENPTLRLLIETLKI